MLAYKEQVLINILQSGSSYALAFSGGTDSTLLLYYLSKLGIKSKAYTFHSYLYPESELAIAQKIANQLGIEHQIIHIDPLKNINDIQYNPKERCYICKKYMFSMLKEFAVKDGLDKIIEGSNYDDNNDYRPGMIACKELSIISPLNMSELTKSDVRLLLKNAGMEYNKPSFACYFSRFPYNMEINKNMIHAVSKCEIFIHSLGLNTIRVRYNNNTARLEGSLEDMKYIINSDIVREKIVNYVKSIGFLFVSLDLEEYKTGSMNRTIT